MATPIRLVPLRRQFEFAQQRLLDRMAGPVFDSGNGQPMEVSAMSDEEYLWEPVPRCWTVRPPAPGAGPGAAMLVGAGAWRRDSATFRHPEPSPFTTIAWRLGHLAEMLTLRSDHLVGSHSLTRDDYHFCGDVHGGIEAFRVGARSWRSVLAEADDDLLDAVGRSSYPYGSDPEVAFVETVWWVNQELLHHGAEIALLRDLYRCLHD